MFENLTDKLERSFKLLKGQGKITEINVASVCIRAKGDFYSDHSITSGLQ